MREVGIYEAKSKLPELIKQVLQGELITITNRGVAVVDIVPSASRIAQQTRNAIAAIKALRTGRITQAKFKEMRTREGR